jgi:chromosome segregation ATPase
MSHGETIGAVGVEPQTALASEIARLRISIDRAATASEITLASRLSAPDDHDAGSPEAEQRELRRQLAALRERVTSAEHTNEDPRALHAELATLLVFARMLQADADSWRSTLDERMKKLEHQRAAARRERERLAAEREKLVRRRDALQLEIVQTAARMAQRDCADCRTTVPVFTLDEGLTVSSVSVFSSRRRLRFAKHWLVTLNAARDDVVVRPL